MSTISTHNDWATSAVAELPPLATKDEVAQVLRCSRRSLERYIALGRIPATRLAHGGGSRCLIARSAVAEFLRAVSE